MLHALVDVGFRLSKAEIVVRSEVQASTGRSRQMERLVAVAARPVHHVNPRAGCGPGANVSQKWFVNRDKLGEARNEE